MVNYHGVSLERFQPLPRPAAHGDADARHLRAAGAVQGAPHSAARRRRVRPPGALSSSIGEGPQRQKLEQLASELGIGDRVEFTGPLPQARLAEIYASADLFVLASVVLERSGKRDVIPNVLAEAMAMRMPVVATSVSGIAELVTDGVSGRLVATERSRGAGARHRRAARRSGATAAARRRGRRAPSRACSTAR